MNKLPGVFALLGQGWALYKERIWAILSAIIFPVFVSIALVSVFGLFFAVAGGAAIASGKFEYAFVLLPLGMLAFLLFVVFQLMVKVAFYLVLEPNKPRRFLQAFKESRFLILGFFFVSLIVNAVVFSGLLLLVIPGIIFAIWYSQADYIRLYEGEKGIRAMQKSHWYVRGKFWGVLGRTLGLACLTLLPLLLMGGFGEALGESGLVVVLAILFNLASVFVLQPLFFCSLVSLYAQLRQAKSQEVFVPSNTERKWIIASAVVIPVLSLVFVGLFAGKALNELRNTPFSESAPSSFGQ